MRRRHVPNGGSTGTGRGQITVGEDNTQHIHSLKFRKYEKTALDKAVASVRSGEMSVHRAGSFYGVPHSTLEYKVNSI